MELLVGECDVIFLTVPDSRIRSVWMQIREYEIEGKTICHCSGALSSADAFPGIEAAGAFGYSVHPLFAVSDKYNVYRELADVFFTLEGGGLQSQAPERSTAALQREVPDDSSIAWPSQDPETESAAAEGGAKMDPAGLALKSMLEQLGNPVETIRAEDKILYHCAATMASNLMCGLVHQSIELMGRCGFTQQDAVKALTPILTGNMEHIVQEGPVRSLTGPVERNDTATVEKHLACLQDTQEKELYRLLSLRLMRMAQDRHPQRDYTGLRKLLEKENSKGGFI